MGKRNDFSELSQIQGTSDFEENDLRLIINYFAKNSIIFTNEIQFQLALAETIHSLTHLNVVFEAVSAASPSPKFFDGEPENSQKKNEKIYTDLVIEGRDGEGDIAIELKYKTTGETAKPKHLNEYHCESLKDISCVCYLVNGKIIPVFSQGAADFGAYHYLMDVERLERLIRTDRPDKITYGFAGRHIQKGYAIIIANDPIYWSKTGRKQTMSGHFFCIDNQTIEKGYVLWKAAYENENGKPRILKVGERKGVPLQEIDSVIYRQLPPEDQSRFVPIKLAQTYLPSWSAYPLNENILSFDENGKERKFSKEMPAFRYLILEVKN
jgi:hypothetical protein